jgi:hypothetical protein
MKNLFSGFAIFFIFLNFSYANFYVPAGFDAYFDFSQEYPKPGESFSITLIEHNSKTNQFPRQNLEFELVLSPELYFGFVDATVQPGLLNYYQVQHQLLGNNRIKITMTDLGIVLFPEDLFKGSIDNSLILNFGTNVAAGTHSLSIDPLTVVYESLVLRSGSWVPQATQAWAVAVAPYEVLVASATLQYYHDELISDLGEPTYIQLKSPQAKLFDDVMFAVTAGQLPSGLTLDEKGSITGTVTRLADVGVHAFTVSFINLTQNTVVAQNFSLEVVNPTAQLLSAEFIDTNNNGVINANDELVLNFSHKIKFGNAWATHLGLNRAGDFLGNPITLPTLDATEKQLTIKLGRFPVLESINKNSSITMPANPTLSVPNSITNKFNNRSPEGINIPITHHVVDNFDWDFGLRTGRTVSIPVIGPTSDPTQNVTITGIPSGLVKIQNTSGVSLQGTLTKSESNILKITVNDRIIVSKPYGVIQDGPSDEWIVYGLNFPMQINPGSEIEFFLKTPSTDPVTVTLGGVNLIALPKSSQDLYQLIVPANVQAGTSNFIISQGNYTQNFGAKYVFNPGSDLALLSLYKTKTITALDQTTYPHKLFLITGSGFNPSGNLAPDIEFNQTPMTIISHDNFHILAELPSEFLNVKTWTLTVKPNVTLSFISTFFDEEIVVTQDGGEDETKLKVKGSGQATGETIDEKIISFRKLLITGLVAGGNSTFTDYKFINWYLWTALHESGGLQKRVQVGGGPGRGLGQMEPNTAADTLLKDGKLRTSAKEALDKAGYEKKEQDKLEEDAKKIQESGENKWPEGSAIEAELVANDAFGAMMARLKFRMDKKTDIKFCGGFGKNAKNNTAEMDLLVNDWIEDWKGKSSDDNVNKMNADQFKKSICAHIEKFSLDFSNAAI